MNPTPLNPDALEAAAAAARIDWSGRTDWNGAPNSVQIEYRNLANAAVSAYLAVAQPVVNSVEELDALPVGSVVLDVYGASVTKIDYATWVRVTPAIPGGRMFHAPYLPARVLYRPEVDDA